MFKGHINSVYMISACRNHHYCLSGYKRT